MRFLKLCGITQHSVWHFDLISLPDILHHVVFFAERSRFEVLVDYLRVLKCHLVTL